MNRLVPIHDARGHVVGEYLEILPLNQGEETMTKFSATENDNLIRLNQLIEARGLIARSRTILTGHQERVLVNNLDAEIEHRIEFAAQFADKLLEKEQK